MEAQILDMLSAGGDISTLVLAIFLGKILYRIDRRVTVIETVLEIKARSGSL